MPLPPSRRDVTGPPPRDVSDLASIVRHHGSYLRSLDPGYLEGRFSTPSPVPPGQEQLVGEDSGGDGETLEWEWNDRHTITVAGTQRPRLSYEPVEESLEVFWHPGDHGGLPLTNEMFTVDEQIVIIPDPGYFELGDTFSFQYPHLPDEPEPINPSLVGFTVPGVFDATPDTQTFALPAGTAAGDLIVLTYRGSQGPGGGDFTVDATCSDPRMTLAYHVPGFPSATWVGIADGSGSPVVLDILNPSYPATAGAGVLATFTGVNGYGVIGGINTGTTTPVVAAIAAVAVVAIHGSPFGVVNAAPPTGYTNIASTGSSYSSTDLSWWHDPDATSSPSGTFTGEGCCVIAMV